MTLHIRFRFLALACLVLLAGCNDSGVSLSGSGGQVAVSQGGQLYIADVEREDWHAIAAEGGKAALPSWSPDGKYVAFELRTEHQATDETGELRRVQVEHAAIHNIQTGQTAKLETDVQAPFVWKPDSSAFAGVHHELRPDRKGDNVSVVFFSPAAGRQRSIPLDNVDVLPIQIDWIPGTDDLVFRAIRRDLDSAMIGLYRTHGSDVERMTDDPMIAGIRATSPHQVLFASLSSGDNSGLLTIKSLDPAGGSPTKMRSLSIPKLRVGGDWRNDWTSVEFSPDGRSLACDVHATRPIGKYQDAAIAGIFAGPLTGHRLVKVHEGKVRLFVSWARSGRRIAILDDCSEDEPQLYIYNSDGSGKRMAPLPHGEKGVARS